MQWTPFYSEEERLMQALMDPNGAVSQLGPQAPSPQMADAMQQQAVTNAATALPEPSGGVLAGGAANGLLDDPSVYGGPLTPSGQAGPQWQQNLQQFLGSPGWAMASQAMLNSDAAQRNQTVGTSPAMAFRQVQMQNQALQMKRAQVLDERRNSALARMKLEHEIGKEPKRERAEDAQGILRYVDDGSMVFEGDKAKAPERDMEEDVNGVLRYIDDGSPVFPSVEAVPEGPDTMDVFSQEKDLRKQFIDLTKGYRESETAFGRILSSAKNPSAAGDLALIFNYMKVLDPSSVVRESEFTTAEQAAGWLEESTESGIRIPRAVASMIRRAESGQRMSPKQRADFVRRASMLYDGASAEYGQLADEHRQLAERYKLRPDNVVVSGRRYSPEDYADLINDPTPTTTMAGDVIGGYRFKGGDPNDRNNWEAVE